MNLQTTRSLIPKQGKPTDYPSVSPEESHRTQIARALLLLLLTTFRVGTYPSIIRRDSQIIARSSRKTTFVGRVSQTSIREETIFSNL
mmetsp:Transcript_21503/g.24359  ORF Transcript_21503/g.24359 Transcript_21503/m.24359 type:complete len:88 (-) Transcript_21503:588-851(-)